MAEGKGYIVSSNEKGSVNISEDVVTVIAATAASDVEGVYGPFITPSKEIAGFLGRKGIAKGVKISIEEDTVAVDVSIIVEIGYAINEVGANVQKAIMAAVGDSLGITVTTVNVNICGIALKKKQA